MRRTGRRRTPCARAGRARCPGEQLQVLDVHDRRARAEHPVERRAAVVAHDHQRPARGEQAPASRQSRAGSGTCSMVMQAGDQVVGAAPGRTVRVEDVVDDQRAHAIGGRGQRRGGGLVAAHAVEAQVEQLLQERALAGADVERRAGARQVRQQRAHEPGVGAARERRLLLAVERRRVVGGVDAAEVRHGAGIRRRRRSCTRPGGGACTRGTCARRTRTRRARPRRCAPPPARARSVAPHTGQARATSGEAVAIIPAATPSARPPRARPGAPRRRARCCCARTAVAA